MSHRFFMLIVFILISIGVHLAYILFVPKSQLSAALADYSSAKGVNKFSVLTETEANQFLKHDPRDIVSAVCLFDLSTGPVEISSAVAGAYWSLSIYSTRGDIIYTLNDRQAASEQVDVTIHRKGNFDSDTPILGTKVPSNTAEVTSEDWQGLIVVRSSVSLPNQTKHISDRLAASTCKS